ncbi:N-formyl peptide receptor 2-like [Ctenodactylus gundi]
MEANSSVAVSEAEEKVDAISTVLHIITTLLVVVTFFLGVLGNGLVIYVAGFRMTRTVTTIFYLNLAVADFSFSVTLPFFIVSLAMEGKWPFGWFLCKCFFIGANINLFGSIFLIALIALDRCICVLHPIWAQNHRTVSLAKKVIIGPWVLALLFSWPVVLFRTTERNAKGDMYCAISFESWGATTEEKLEVARAAGIAESVLRFTFGFSLPVVIVVICYGLIAAKIRRKNLIKTSHPFRVLTAVVSSFFICWFPTQLISLLITICLNEMLTDNHEVLFVLFLLVNPAESLAFFNSCLNPILYVFVCRDFRKTLVRSLPTSLERALSEDWAQTSDTGANSSALTGEIELQAMSGGAQPSP